VDAVDALESRYEAEQEEPQVSHDSDEAVDKPSRCTRSRAIAGMLLLGAIITAIVMWQTGQLSGSKLLSWGERERGSEGGRQWKKDIVVVVGIGRVDR
jgi:hypothetical protein